MTLQELDELLLDTRKLPRAQDKVAHHLAIAVIEIARQLVILNEQLRGQSAAKLQPAAAGKRVRASSS